jgi:hypothetical protein
MAIVVFLYDVFTAFADRDISRGLPTQRAMCRATEEYGLSI